MDAKPKRIRQQLRALFDQARSDHQYQGCWLTGDFWVAVLNSMIGERLFDTSVFNRFMADDRCGFMICDIVSSSNTSGIYRVKFYDEYFYYISRDEEMFQKPMMTSEWARDIKDYCLKHKPTVSESKLIFSTPRDTISTTPNIESAKKSSIKRGQPDPFTPPSSVKRKRLIFDHSNLSVVDKHVNKVQAGKKAIESIRESAKKPLKKKISILKKKSIKLERKRMEVENKLNEAMKKVKDQAKEIKRLKESAERELEKALKQITPNRHRWHTGIR